MDGERLRFFRGPFAKVGEDRAKAVAEMARVTEEVAKGRQAIADLEEEARKSGVPPGWLR